MTVGELINVLDSILALPAETEVVELKKAGNQFDDRDLGKCFSALSNEANLKGRPCAWLVSGVENVSHAVAGSNYKASRPSLDAMKNESQGPDSDRYMI